MQVHSDVQPVDGLHESVVQLLPSLHDRGL
jgi:hypothetical protein